MAATKTRVTATARAIMPAYREDAYTERDERGEAPASIETAQ